MITPFACRGDKLLAVRREAWSAILSAVDWEPHVSAKPIVPSQGVVSVLTVPHQLVASDARSTST
jgi:hypothetical protein